MKQKLIPETDLDGWLNEMPSLSTGSHGATPAPRDFGVSKFL